MQRTSTLFALALSTGAFAQCPFDPTIIPADVILCPEESAVLSTQEYDTYQWYRDGQVIDGAIGQTHTVQAFEDGGYSFTVEVTLDGCTEMSPAVLVNGWVFLLPYVIHGGAEPLYTDGNGVPHHCAGDSVWLVFSWDTNVQWTDQGTDIPNATNDSLLVLNTGSYSASGAPEVCPNFTLPLGLDVELVFDAPTVPVINVVGDQLCATPAGVAYQWYVNGAPLAGDGACIDANTEGNYVVLVTYDPNCSAPSEPYLVTGMKDPSMTSDASVFPVPSKDRVNVQWPGTTSIGAWRMIDATGRTIKEGDQQAGRSIVIDVSSIANGRYWVRAAGLRPVPIVVTR